MKMTTLKSWKQIYPLYERNKQQIYTNVKTKVLNSSMLLYIDMITHIFFVLYTEHVWFTHPLDTPVRSVIIFTSFTEPYLAKKLLISVSSIYEEEFDFKSKNLAFKIFNYIIKKIRKCGSISPKNPQTTCSSCQRYF